MHQHEDSAHACGDLTDPISLSQLDPKKERSSAVLNQESTVQSRSSLQHNSEPTTSPPPNGGLTAWMQCFNVFLLWFAAWGLVNSFGVFQAYYTTTYFTSISASRISWIGSLQLCIFILGSIIVGPLYDTGHLRILLVLGAFLTVFGMTLTSVQTTYAGVILSQGLCMGIGMTCTFIPLVSVLPPYFSSRRSLAMGLAATGSSIGAIIFTVVFQQMISETGFGWTTRTLALLLFVTLIIPTILLRKRVPNSTRRSLIDVAALRQPAFNLCLCAMFVVFMGLYVPYFYIEVFALRKQVLETGHEYLAKYLIVILNVGSLIGRLLPNILADHLGPWNMIVLSTTMTGLLGFCWIAISNQSGLIAFCFFYGFFSGSFVALVPVIWASLSPDPKMLGTRTGMMTVPMATGLLIGNPIAGALVRGNRFVDLQIFCGSTVMGAALILGAGRLFQGRTAGSWKV